MAQLHRARNPDVWIRPGHTIHPSGSWFEGRTVLAFAQIDSLHDSARREAGLSYDRTSQRTGHRCVTTVFPFALIAALVAALAMHDDSRAQTQAPSGLTSVPGLKVGHAEMPGRPTGCTVVLAEAGSGRRRRRPWLGPGHARDRPAQPRRHGREGRRHRAHRRQRVRPRRGDRRHALPRGARRRLRDRVRQGPDRAGRRLVRPLRGRPEDQAGRRLRLPRSGRRVERARRRGQRRRGQPARRSASSRAPRARCAAASARRRSRLPVGPDRRGARRGERGGRRHRPVHRPRRRGRPHAGRQGSRRREDAHPRRAR